MRWRDAVTFVSLLLAGTACSSTNTNDTSASGGSGGATGGTGGAGGSIDGAAGSAAAGSGGSGASGDCSDQGGGLLGDDGSLETGSTSWFGDVKGIAATGVCGTHSLEVLGSGSYAQARHDFLPPTAGDYIFSFCGKAPSPGAIVSVFYLGPETNTAYVSVLSQTALGSDAWSHHTTDGISVSETTPHTLQVAIEGPTQGAGQLDCMALTKK